MRLDWTTYNCVFYKLPNLRNWQSSQYVYFDSVGKLSRSTRIGPQSGGIMEYV